MAHIGSGSGFFISPNHLVTNFHVVSGCRAMTVGNNSEGEEVDAKVIATDPNADLAVLVAEEKDIQPAQFLTAPLTESREDLAIVGYPEHGLPVLQAELHHISVYEDDLLRGGTRYDFFGNVRRGNSGGPLLDNQGAVVGVVTAKIDTVALYRKTGAVVDDVGIAIANHTVFAFLTANNIDFQSADAAASAADLPSDALLEKAHSFVRQVGCWR
jgi:S1-C subfamily serine protease